MEPKFRTQNHADIKGEIMLDYAINRPAADAEEASDIDIKADILAGTAKHLQWRQEFILRQLFAESQEMPYLILAARNLAGIEWEDGTRAQGKIRFLRQTPAGSDFNIPAGMVMVSDPDSEGNIIRASLLYAVTLKTGETVTVGIAEIIEVQASTLVSYEIPASGGGALSVAVQETGSGLAGNIPDGTIIGFEAAPPTGVETLSSASAGLAGSKSFTAATKFSLTGGVNDELNVDIDGAGDKLISLSGGTNVDGSVIAAQIESALRSGGTGGYVLAMCRYNMTGTDYQFIVFSGTTGTSSSVTVSAGTNDASVDLGLDQAILIAGAAGFTGGIDPQTKASLKSEYKTAIKNGGEAGTTADYVAWAKDSGQGVDDAKVTGLTGGVVVYPITNSGVFFSQGQLDAILTFIETKAPVHLVGSISVLNPTVVAIYVEATIVLVTGFTLASVSAELKQVIKNYMTEVPIGDVSGTAIVRYSKISAAMLSVLGVDDITGLVVDTITPPSGTSNIVLAEGTVAQTDDGKITLL